MRKHYNEISAVLALSVLLGCFTGCSDSAKQNMTAVEKQNDESIAESVVESTDSDAYSAETRASEPTAIISPDGSTVEIPTETTESETASDSPEEAEIKKAKLLAVQAGASEDDWRFYLPADNPAYVNKAEFDTATPTSPEYVKSEADKAREENDAAVQAWLDGDKKIAEDAPDGNTTVAYDGNGNELPETGRDVTHQDWVDNLPEGLGYDLMHGLGDGTSITFDNCYVTMGQFTPNSLIQNTEHEWHYYNSAKSTPDYLAPGEHGFLHIDSDYFSSPENRKTSVTKKNGQVVLYVKNTSDATLSAMDCTVHKIYISYASHGIYDYMEIPVVEYMGLKIFDDASSVIDGSYFGKPRLKESLAAQKWGENYFDMWRFYYGSIEVSAANIDVIKTSDGYKVIGFTIGA